MNTLKTLPLLLLLATSTNIFADEHTAILFCSLQGMHISIYPCFTDTDLKITKNGRSKVYKAYELTNFGTEQSDGIHFSLPNSFSIKAQNSHNASIFGIEILNKQNEVIYEDQAGQWDIIKAGN